MTCYFHEQTEAAGLCTHCGKAVCKQCLVEADEMLLCKNCVAARLRRLPGRLHLPPIPPEKLVAAGTARTIVRVSWILAIVSTVAVFIFMLVAGPSGLGMPPKGVAIVMFMLDGVLCGYVFWAWYWGTFSIWRWWRRVSYQPVQFFLDRLQFTGFPFVLFVLFLLLFLPATLTVVAMYFWIPFLIALPFGVFGGGVAQCRRYKQAMRASA